MSDQSRAPFRLLAYVLAVPIIVLTYAGAFGTRVWVALRPSVAALLGATIIGSVYADEALKRAPQTPVRAAAVFALAIALVGHGMAPAPASAANDPVEAVIAAAKEKLGQPYRLGAEGPRLFDCSGLIFRVFEETGNLPRIGGMRLRAVQYQRWFVSRGLFTRDVDKADRGDLVVWDMGEHIGIYLGEGRAISALINPWGITVHSIHGINQSVDYFLKVDWRNGDGGNDNGNGNPGDGNGDGNGNGEPGDGGNDNGGEDPGDGDGDGNNNGRPDNPSAQPGNGGNDNGSSDRPGNGNTTDYGTPADGNNGNENPDDGNGPPDDGNGNPEPEPEPEQPNGRQAIADGTMNLRVGADPEGRIIGWIHRGTRLTIVSEGNSPAGYLWYEVRTVSGKHGWVWSHWVSPV